MLRYTSQILILVLTSVFLQAKQDQKMIRILCFGDSITHKGQWHQIVSQDPEFETINAGRSGRRIAQGVKELPQYLKKHHKVDKLIILLGVNDLPARDTRPGQEKIASCIKNMNATVELALKHFKAQDIIILAPPNVNPETMSDNNKKKGYDICSPLLKQLEEAYKKLAEQRGINFFSVYETISQDEFPDGLHPSKKGQEQLGKAVLRYLKQGKQNIKGWPKEVQKVNYPATFVHTCPCLIVSTMGDEK